MSMNVIPSNMFDVCRLWLGLPWWRSSHITFVCFIFVIMVLVFLVVYVFIIPIMLVIVSAVMDTFIIVVLHWLLICGGLRGFLGIYRVMRQDTNTRDDLVTNIITFRVKPTRVRLQGNCGLKVLLKCIAVRRKRHKHIYTTVQRCWVYALYA